MPYQEQNTKILPNNAPIIVTWTPREPGATLPDGENSKLNYVDILIKHKQENNEERDIILFVNGSGLKPGQMDELKDKFKEVKGIHVIDLHDPKYDCYWKEIDKGWQINGKPISIKEYYQNMYNMQDEDRTYFAIEIDTFRYIAAYCVLREQEKLQKDLGVIYIDFDALRAISSNNYKENRKFYKHIEQKGIGIDIKIPYGVLAPCDKEEMKCMNNDVFAITDYHILQEICDLYKGNILDQSEMVEVLREQMVDKSLANFLPSDKDLGSVSAVEILYNIFYSSFRGFLLLLNSAQRSFLSIITNMMIEKYKSDEGYIINDEDYIINIEDSPPDIGDNEFDFAENGGEYASQDSGCENDISWLKENYIQQQEKKEEFQEQSADPSTQVDVRSPISPNTSPPAKR